MHFSVQGEHLHLVVEATDERALSSLIRRVSIRAARPDGSHIVTASWN